MLEEKSRNRQVGRNDANSDDAEVSEAQIAVHWREEEYVAPPAQFVAQANLTDPGIFERFGETNFPQCFREFADLLDWFSPWNQILDTSTPPFWRWFIGGRINACHNCVDRHLAKYKNKTAFHFYCSSPLTRAKNYSAATDASSTSRVPCLTARSFTRVS